MDSYSKRVLDNMIQNGGCDNEVDFDDGIDKMASDLNVKVEDLRANIRYLKEEGYIEYSYYRPSNIAASFHLSHKGRRWRQFRFDSRMSYIADKWIDFFTMIISFTAFVLSLIALLT